MNAQPSPMNQTHEPTEKVIPFPGNTNHRTKLATDNAVWAMFDSGVFAALRSVPVGPACQAVYMALIRRLPNVRPSLSRLASDTGLNRSTVARALNILETIGLIQRHHSHTECGDPATTAYELADLRDPKVAKRCRIQIRQLIDQKSTPSEGGSCTGATTGGSRMGATRGSRTRAPKVVAPVRPKDPIKKQNKQQEASPLVGGENVDDFREEIIKTLRRWGISNPAYLLNPDNESAIPKLIQRPHEAAKLIDRAMKLRQWTPDCGPGLRVRHLQSHIREAADLLEADRRADEIRRRRLSEKARAAIDRLPQAEVSGIDELPVSRRDELLRRGLEAIGEPEDVTAVIAADQASCRRVVAHELHKEELGHKLDTMTDEDLDLLKQELLMRVPNIRTFFRNTDTRSKTMRGLLIKQLSIRQAGQRERHESVAAIGNDQEMWA